MFSRILNSAAKVIRVESRSTARVILRSSAFRLAHPDLGRLFDGLSGRVRRYCLAAAVCFLSLPAIAFAEQHTSISAATPVADFVAENVSSGVNPDYTLPDYPASENSLSESSSSRAAASPPSSPLPRPSKEDPSADREVSLQIAAKFSA